MSTMEKTAFMIWVIGITISVVQGQVYQGCNNGNGFVQNQMGAGNCGCAQNFNNMMNQGSQVSPACRGPLPCYDIVINNIADGEMTLDVVNEEQEYLRPFALAGRMRQEVLAEGRKAAVFFRDTFGPDFTSMRDDEFLRGRRMNSAGVEFRPYIFGAAARYRLYTASTRGDTQLFNRPITDHGWILNFTRPMWGTGSFRKLIPAGTFAVFGDYIIHPCGRPDMENPNFMPCRNILNEQDPWAPIFLRYMSPTYIQIVQEPYPYLVVDCIFSNARWGIGRGRAVATFRDTSDDSLVIDRRMTVTFPSSK